MAVPSTPELRHHCRQEETTTNRATVTSKLKDTLVLNALWHYQSFPARSKLAQCPISDLLYTLRPTARHCLNICGQNFLVLNAPGHYQMFTPVGHTKSTLLAALNWLNLNSSWPLVLNAPRHYQGANIVAANLLVLCEMNTNTKVPNLHSRLVGLQAPPINVSR